MAPDIARQREWLYVVHMLASAVTLLVVAIWKDHARFT